MLRHVSASSFAPSVLTLLCAIALGLTTVACSDGGSADNNANNGVCQYDCFADYRCENGIVYEKQGGPISCSQASSAQQAAQICANRGETELRTCTEGCRTDIDNISQYPSYTPDLCIGDRLARPGDSCEDDNDCRPSDVGFGTMFCEAGSCVDPNAPEDAGMSDAGDAGNEDTSEEDVAEDTSTEDASTEDAEDDASAQDAADDTGASDADSGSTDTGSSDDASAADADDDASDTGSDDATD